MEVAREEMAWVMVMTDGAFFFFPRRVFGALRVVGVLEPLLVISARPAAAGRGAPLLASERVHTRTRWYT